MLGCWNKEAYRTNALPEPESGTGDVLKYLNNSAKAAEENNRVTS
jgi:hypothetical protein